MDRYKRALQVQEKFFGIPTPETEDGKPNYIGFWLPLLALSFAGGFFAKEWMAAGHSMFGA